MIKKYTLIIYILIASPLIAIAYSLATATSPSDYSLHFTIGVAIFSPFYVLPFLLTIFNLLFLVYHPRTDELRHNEKIIVWMTWILGVIYSFLYLVVNSIDYQFSADWNEQLINTQLHTPIWTHAKPTLYVLVICGLIAYFYLKTFKPKNSTPLKYVTAISFNYLSVGIAILWILQIGFNYLALLPLNYVFFSLKAIRNVCEMWRIYLLDNPERFKQGTHQTLLNILNNSSHWPLLALVLSIPLLGILIGILMLFGQQPDAVIKAWTETSDWNLSTKVSPPNIIRDEHYLCTVAAGGHQKVVKPIRCGVRHGHDVVVNRQLCIANAFEQILEERIPRTHKVIRKFYDTYGYPIARHIHSPYLADIVYLIMKPLELLFWLVLYWFDANPENRIAVQYIE